ncbi:MAG: hypothetical protein RIG62_00550 [Cyclobacteriaceae bacterium]
MKISLLLPKSNFRIGFIAGCFSMILFPNLLFAQSVGVVISKDNEANPAASAILDVQSTEKGMLIPRMTKAQRDGISSPSSGLLIYQTNDSPGFYYHNGASWEALKNSGSEGITKEIDPKVGDNIENYLSKWDGSQLIASKIKDDGSGEIDIEGSVRNTGRIYSDGISSSSDAYVNGWVVARDPNNNDRAYLAALPSNTGHYGYMETTGPNGTLNNRISIYPNKPNNGYIALADDRGELRAEMWADSDGKGKLRLDNILADIVTANQVVTYNGTKHFVIDHPNQPGKQIVYACVEGPEAAMYMRGTAKLVNGKAIINLPEHYRVLAVESSMTVHVTPLSKSSTGLAVTAKNLDGIVVEELMNGSGSYELDWEVKCVRRGFEDYRVVRDKANTSTFLGGTQD